MPGSAIPVIRQPFEPGDLLPFWVGRAAVDRHELYDLDVDPDEQENRVGERVESEMIELLRTGLASRRRARRAPRPPRPGLSRATSSARRRARRQPLV